VIPVPPAARGLIVAAPASGSGKTVVTLALLRHFAAAGVRVASAKVGPDYIDPAFHAAAGGGECLNLDPWAMRPATLAGIVGRLAGEADLILCEGVMGLFDGATATTGSTADIAAAGGWPVLLVVDARAQAASAAAVVRGFAGHRPDVAVGGVVFNRVGGERHARVLGEACAASLPDVPVLGCLPRADDLALPERHLGLVQAAEHPDLGAFLDLAAGLVEAHVDLAAVAAMARPWRGLPAVAPAAVPLPPPGQRIAVARDEAFAFAYPLTLAGWRSAGAEVVPFSPLADQPPAPDADAVYLPGGYPELHAGRLAAAGRFLEGLRRAAERDAAVFGECGGYMVLGDGLIDAAGRRHSMAGLLPVETSFAERRLHLGYRRATLIDDTPLGRHGTRFRGHEFHYARIVDESGERRLFDCDNADGEPAGPAGLIRGTVFGSFVHLIDREA
jgi:cobyrinic acid a,c-diamide synthase